MCIFFHDWTYSELKSYFNNSERVHPQKLFSRRRCKECGEVQILDENHLYIGYYSNIIQRWISEKNKYLMTDSAGHIGLRE